MKPVIRKSFGVLSTAGLVVAAALSLTFCGGSDSNSGGGGGGGGGGVTLTAEDFPGVGVCATGTVDVTKAPLKTALGAATAFTFMHEPYATDADIPFICGKQGSWDPSTPGAFDATNTLDMTDTVANILGGFFGSVFICNDGFTFAGGNYGLHGATTYRGELTFSDGTTTYRMRLRFTVSGPDADKTLASLGITDPSQVKFTDANGNLLDTAAKVRDLLVTDPTNITVNVVTGDAAPYTTHITATGGVICAGTTT